MSPKWLGAYAETNPALILLICAINTDDSFRLSYLWHHLQLLLSEILHLGAVEVALGSLRLKNKLEGFLVSHKKYRFYNYPDDPVLYNARDSCSLEYLDLFPLNFNKCLLVPALKSVTLITR
jgi:hypothetical protein